MVWPGPPVKVVVDGRLHDWDRMGVEWRNRIAVVVTAAGAAGMTVDMGAVVPPSDLLLHPDLSAVSWLMGGVRLAPAGARVLSWSFDGRSGLMRVSSDGSRWRVREGAGLVADRVSPCSAICRLTGEEDLRPL